jgi:hypothetical protein
MRTEFISTVIGAAESREHRLVPHRPAIEGGEDIREGHDREQVAQTRTGFGHVQAQDAQVDDVAFQEHRHIHELQEEHAQFRRDQLQPGVELEIEDAGQGQHEHQVQNRGPEMPARLPAEADQKQAADPQDRGIGDDVRDIGQLARRADGDGGEDHGHADPAVALRSGFGREFLELAQEQKPREDRDQGPVAVFRQAPRFDQRV